ncbi:hypothetical protein AUJ62_03825 [Candidatus Pacearchaeota archaeon CG1_02_32_21]|nr:MAG: hypothetical protein AUJ62_03825 [Candidatus Pacearchaeota archaeon CG1_02_32_21]
MAEKNVINIIMEGANHDSPSVLGYVKLPSDLVSIDENVRAFHYLSNKFLLYATTKNFKNIELKDVNPNVEAGFSLNPPLCLWVILEAQRSFITRDGRVYVDSDYLRDGWRWYLDAMPSIIEDSRRLFNGEISENDINLHPRSVFVKEK